MPIITTQRRMAEQGRIRLGQKVTGTSQQGKTFTRPDKLDRFRFTSPSKRLIDEIAATYGGTAQAWDNAGKNEFEVISDATAIPVIVVKGGFSQWHEHWTKAGCQHRCDGEKDAAGTYCDPEDEFHRLAIEKPTTRLSVMLSEIESLGVWRMETKGWNAAAELPSMAELAMHVGDLVPATLGLAERSSIIQTDKGPQTSRYVVPYLDLHVTKQRLVEIAGHMTGGVAEVEAPAQAAAPALAAPSLAPESAAPAVEMPSDAHLNGLDVDGLRGVWEWASAQGVLDVDDLRGRITARVEALRTAQSQAPAQPPVQAVPDEDGAVDAELVPDEPTPAPAESEDVIWQRIVEAAGQRGVGLADLQDDFAQAMGGVTADSASAAELQHYLGLLQERAA